MAENPFITLVKEQNTEIKDLKSRLSEAEYCIHRIRDALDHNAGEDFIRMIVDNYHECLLYGVAE